LALTREFKETVRARVQRDPRFRKVLLREGIESLLAGDVPTAKTILRDYINATIGFTETRAKLSVPNCLKNRFVRSLYDFRDSENPPSGLLC